MGARDTENRRGRSAELLNAIPMRKKVALLVAACLVAGAVVFALTWARTPDYGLLFGNLDQEDMQAIVSKLKEKKQDYKVSGSSIMVPQDKVYELRMELAGEGIPKGGVVGLELFDKNSIGMTDFLQKVNYKRALQGELVRTIRQLSEVEDCRVNLVIPEKTLFEDTREHSRASVVLKLKPGAVLGQEQARAIVHLISGSVDDLAPEDVTLLDTRGKLLSRPKDDDPAAMLSNSQLEYKRAVEKDLESRLQSMLETVLGQGKAVVRVTADVDFTKQEESDEKYDPTTVLRSQQKDAEKEMGGSQVAYGVPGASSNLPGRGQPAAARQPGPNSERQSEVSNYEVSMSKTHTIRPIGVVKSLSAAVLVDGTYKTLNKKTVYTARTQDEMTKLDGIVKGALGFNAQRGDKVDIVNMPFDTGEQDGLGDGMAVSGAAGGKWYTVYVLPYVKYAVVAFGMLMLLVFVVRPLVKSLSRSLEQPVPGGWEGGPVKISELESSLAAPPQQKMVPSAAGVKEIMQQNPARAASVVKAWLKER